VARVELSAGRTGLAAVFAGPGRGRTAEEGAALRRECFLRDGGAMRGSLARHAASNRAVDHWPAKVRCPAADMAYGRTIRGNAKHAPYEAQGRRCLER